MKLTYKRLLIFFSVALNLGFVIAGLVMLQRNSIPVKVRFMREFTIIVKQLELPKTQSQTVLDNIRQFQSTVDHVHEDLKDARGDILRLLSQKGPVAPEELHFLFEDTDRLGKFKSEIFEAHVLALRQLLGEEKGAQFFYLLEQHIKSEDKGRHR
ncbi:MAG: hypothetical protein QM498_03355 [Desulfobacterium sp.]